MAEAFTAAHEGRIREVCVAAGSHPVPDEASVEAGLRALAMARDARQRDATLIVLLSGGASAMLEAPAEGITLADTIALTRVLLRGGLPIADVNAIRKHVSAIKGGQLAVAAGRSITFALSDVHGPVENDPAVIGSGPTVADPTTFADALAALTRDQRGIGPGHALDDPAWPLKRVLDRLRRGVRGEIEETPKPGDPRLTRAQFVLAGSRQDAMDGACAEAARRGYLVERVEAPTIGEASAAARAFLARVPGRAERPLCVVASGETTVTLGRAPGHGGRNQEFALAAVRGLSALADAALASIGTDGIDGPTDAAGAIVDDTTLARARALGLDPDAALAAHDSHPFFRALGDLVVTGATGTNVGDLQVLLRGQGARG